MVPTAPENAYRNGHQGFSVEAHEGETMHYMDRLTEAARAAGVDLGDIPTVAEVVRIAEVLGVDAADLILG